MLGNSGRFQKLQKFVRVEHQVPELKSIGIQKKFLGCRLVKYTKNTSHMSTSSSVWIRVSFGVGCIMAISFLGLVGFLKVT